ncbi:MAG TPA: hypothetical protein VFG62_05760 [Rhodopila sp.]|jgi:hypothetical protein|nr:hypothetical protein [Rhodopila sp.]
MSLADLPEALLQTILHQIALLLLAGANGDMDAARHAAAATLSTYAPRTEAELRLAARIVSCSLQAGEALAQAADPEMPLTRVLRLRSGAVSLNREADKAECRLEKLRSAQPQDAAPEAEPAPTTEPRIIEKTTALIEDNRSVAAYAKAHGLSFTEALRQRRREQRLAERRRKQDAKAQAA